jgi:hypothetical protein
MTIRSSLVRLQKRVTDEDKGQRNVINGLGVVTAVGMLALSVWVLFAYLAPAYSRPAALATDAEVPNPTNAQFDSLATLLGYEASSDAVQAGEALDISLYWQVDNQPPGDYLLFVHLIDGAGTMVSQRDTHPGLGNFPSSQWRPGDRFVEHIRLYVPKTAYGPEVGTLSIGLYEPDGYRLAVNDASGRKIGDSLTLTEISIVPQEGDVANPQALDFANDLLLTGYEYNQRVLAAGDELAVTLHWQALQDIDSDYIIRIRLLDTNGRKAAVVKHRPQSGELPTTSWQAGQSVQDVYRLGLPGDLSPGRYGVDLDVIDATTGDRVHILADDGHQINSHLPLAEIRIFE